MKTPTDRLIGLFAIFFTAALPLFSGMIAAGCHPVLAETLGLSRGNALAPLTLFVFDNFNLLLWGLFAIAALLVAAGSVFYVKQKDAVLRTGQLMMVALMSAVISVIFSGILLLAATISFSDSLKAL